MWEKLRKWPSAISQTVVIFAVCKKKKKKESAGKNLGRIEYKHSNKVSSLRYFSITKGKRVKLQKRNSADSTSAK